MMSAAAPVQVKAVMVRFTLLLVDVTLCGRSVCRVLRTVCRCGNDDGLGMALTSSCVRMGAAAVVVGLSLAGPQAVGVAAADSSDAAESSDAAPSAGVPKARAPRSAAVRAECGSRSAARPETEFTPPGAMSPSLNAMAGERAIPTRKTGETPGCGSIGKMTAGRSADPICTTSTAGIRTTPPTGRSSTSGSTASRAEPLANLTNANLASARTGNATDFSGSDFTGANFRNNDGRGENFTYWRSDIDWTGATWPNGKKSIGRCNADLS